MHMIIMIVSIQGKLVCNVLIKAGQHNFIYKLNSVKSLEWDIFILLSCN